MVDEAALIVIGPVPSKFTPLIARAVASAVAVPASPVMLICTADEVEIAYRFPLKEPVRPEPR